MTAATVAAQARTPGRLAHHTAGLPRTFWLMFTALGASRLGFVVIPFLGFWIVNDRHLAPTGLAAVMACFGAGWTAGPALGGWAADRYGRKAVIVNGSLAAAVAYLLLGTATTPTQLCLWAAATGATFDLARPAVQALMTDAVATARRPAAHAALYWVMNASRCASCAIGGALAVAGGFWWLFAFNAVANVGFAAAVTLTIDDPHHRHAAARPRWRQVLTDRRMLAFTAVSLIFFTVHSQSIVTLPMLFNQAGVDAWQYGLILAVDPAAVVLAQLLTQRRLMAARPGLVCAAGTVAVGAGIIVTGLGDSLAWFLATTPIWVAGECAFLIAAPAIIDTLAPPQLRAAYFGIWTATLGASGLLAPALAATATTLGGTPLLWAVCAGLTLAAAAGCLRLRITPHATNLEATP